MSADVLLGGLRAPVRDWQGTRGEHDRPGVFERWPDARFVLIECGIAWLPAIRLRGEIGLSRLFITHDPALIRTIADRVGVMIEE